MLTYGWGHLADDASDKAFISATGKTLNLFDPNTVITYEDANTLLKSDIDSFCTRINEKLEGFGAELNQFEYDALFLTMYQSGVNHMEDNDLASFLKSKEYINAENWKYQLGEYSGSKEKPDVRDSIRKRRNDELDIILKGDYDRDDQVDTYGDIWGKLTKSKEN